MGSTLASQIMTDALGWKLWCQISLIENKTFRKLPQFLLKEKDAEKVT
jgi:hypothetical protein